MKVTQEHFGAIYTGFPQDANFLAVLSEIEAHILRWPGGTLAELRPEVYDIAADTIFDATHLYQENPFRQRLSIEEATHFMGASETLNIIVPTFRYIGNFNKGLSDIDTLIERLKENASLNGKTIRLEIGNEYYAIDGFDADMYGEIASTFVSHIGRIDESDLDFALEVSVQSGKTVADSNSILSHFDQFELSFVDAINVHALPINLNNLYMGSGEDSRFVEMAEIFAEWSKAFATYDLFEPERHFTAWTVGQAANSPSEVELEFQDYGARAASTTIALFGEMLNQGISEASVWGVGVQNLNSLGRVEDGQVVLSHSGVVFKELSNSVVGLELLDGFGSIQRQDSSLPNFGYEIYSAPGRAVVYAVNGEIENSSSLYLSRIQGFDAQSARLVEAKAIKTVYEEGYYPSGSPEDRLYELPDIVDVSSDPHLIEARDGVVEFINLECFQITEATYSWKHTGSIEDDVINGLIHSDHFDGDLGNDTLRGFGGDDFLVGGSGSDYIEGGIGGDLLIGDDQSDLDWQTYWEFA